MDCSREMSLVAQAYQEEYQLILQEMKEKMLRAELTPSISANFITQMLPHHQGTVKLCRSLLRYTTCIDLQNMALALIEQQTECTAAMEELHRRSASFTNMSYDLRGYQRAFFDISQSMFRQLEQVRPSNDINACFVSQLLPLCQSALPLCRNALRFMLCPELVPIVKGTLRFHEKQAEELRQFQTRQEQERSK